MKEKVPVNRKRIVLPLSAISLCPGCGKPVALRPTGENGIIKPWRVQKKNNRNKPGGYVADGLLHECNRLMELNDKFRRAHGCMHGATAEHVRALLETGTAPDTIARMTGLSLRSVNQLASGEAV